MKLAWILETVIKKGFRVIKTRMTSGLIETSKQANPFGFESNPSKNYVAILSETQSNEEPVIIGFLNPKALESLNVGDSRIYSTDSEGNTKASIIIRNDGTAELLGTADNAVRFKALDDSLQTYADNINAQLKTALAGIPYTWVDVTLDISASKIDEIKTL